MCWDTMGRVAGEPHPEEGSPTPSRGAPETREALWRSPRRLASSLLQAESCQRASGFCVARSSWVPVPKGRSGLSWQPPQMSHPSCSLGLSSLFLQRDSTPSRDGSCHCPQPGGFSDRPHRTQPALPVLVPTTPLSPVRTAPAASLCPSVAAAPARSSLTVS